VQGTDLVAAAVTVCVGCQVRDGVGPVLQDAGQQLDRYQQRDGRPAGDDPADRAGAGGRDVRGQARCRPDRKRGPGEPARPPARAPVGRQDE
jgi:hypothetical protein